MQEQSFHPLEYLSLIQRRRWWLVTPLAACVIGGILLAVLLPRIYRSHATIGVSTPKLSTNLVGSAAPLSREERVQAIAHQLLSRPVLERVAKAEGLADGRSLDEAVDHMLEPDRIKVEPTELLKQVASDRPQLDAFVLSYSSNRPELAQRVTNRLADVFVEVNTRARAARAEDTSAFIGSQLASSKERLDALEARLRVAKESYMGSLPEQTQANLSMAAGLRQQLESTAISLRGEQDRLSMIERQIDAMQQGSDVMAGIGATGPARVLQLQQQLADARAMYTDKHPEIQRLQEELAQVRRDEQSRREQPEADRMSVLRFDPTYRQLLADRETARLRVRDLQRAERQARGQVGVYQSRVESAPKVEQQLASLQREYDLEREQYTALSEKLQAAQLAENLEQGQGGEQFRVLYGAYLPGRPESPNVPRLLLIAVGLGLALGGAAALGREYFDRSVHDVRGLQSEFDVPVLGEISTISRPAA